MKIQEVKFNNLNNKYSIFIGHNIIKILPNKQTDLTAPHSDGGVTIPS